MSGSLDEKAKYQLWASRESWCAVEMKKEQDWCRTERQHYGHHIQSSVGLFQQGPAETEERCTFKVDDNTHKEKRHFAEKRKYNRPTTY
jgi:hypothetical protein